MKSSSDGPCSSVSLKAVFGADGPDVAGVASERICLDTEMRATRWFLRTNDIVHCVDRAEVKYPSPAFSAAAPSRHTASINPGIAGRYFFPPG